MIRHRFYFLLTQARRALHRVAERECQEGLGISVVQLGALWVLSSRPGCRQKELAGALALNEPAVTGLLSRMEKAGLVERRRSETDARVLEAYPTEHALAMLEQAREPLARFNDRLAEGFSDAELEVVARFLKATIEKF